MSHSALEWAPWSPPGRRASRLQVVNGTLGLGFPRPSCFGGTMLLLVLGLWAPVYWLGAQGSGASQSLGLTALGRL